MGAPGRSTTNDDPNDMNQHNKNKTVTICSWNCAKGHATTVSILQSASADHQCLFLLLQEPWLEPSGSPPHHPNFDCYYPTKKPRCVTYVRKHRSIDTHTSFSHSNSYIGLSVSLPNQDNFTIYNFYSPGRSQSFVDLITTRNFIPASPSVIIGDFNSHHPWWDSHLHNRKNRLTNDETIANWFLANAFMLQNTPGVPTFFGRTNINPTVIDLMFTTGFLSNKVLAWDRDENTTSDHAICSLSLDISPVLAEATKLNWRKANWTLFKELITKNTRILTD